jgi:regulator of RNase E activity RraA
VTVDHAPVEVTAEQLDALRREDCTAVYNVLKFAGLADPAAYSGPELRCLFPDLPLPIVGFASTAEWTAGETGGANVDSLAWLDHMEATEGPKVVVMQDVGSNPGRGGIVGDGMISEYLAMGAVGAVIGGSVMDIIPMTKLRTPIWATGVVPAYDQLRMAAFGQIVRIGPLTVADGDVIMADQGGVIRIPRGAVPIVLKGMPAFRELERSIAELLRKPGLTARELREWYAKNEPEFLGDEKADEA